MVSGVPAGGGGGVGVPGPAGGWGVPGRPDALPLQMSGDKGISAFPESDNLFKWIGTIDGAAGTVSDRDTGLGGGGGGSLAPLPPAEGGFSPILSPLPPAGAPPASQGLGLPPPRSRLWPPALTLPPPPPGLRGAAVQAVAGVPQRVPLHRAHGAVPDALLPPQRRHPGQHLPRHPQGQVVGPLRCPHHPALHPEPAGRWGPQPRCRGVLGGRGGCWGCPHSAGQRGSGVQGTLPADLVPVPRAEHREPPEYARCRALEEPSR